MDILDYYYKGLRFTADPGQTWWFAPLAWLRHTAYTAASVSAAEEYSKPAFTEAIMEMRPYVEGVRTHDLLGALIERYGNPAGHVHLWSAIYHLTDEGTSIHKAQILFTAVHLASLALAMLVYRKCRAPPYLFPLLLLPKKMQETFVVRFSDDSFALLFLLAALLAFQYRHWVMGSVAFSLGAGSSATILTALPALILILVQAMPLKRSVFPILAIVLVQVVAVASLPAADPTIYLEQIFQTSEDPTLARNPAWEFMSVDLFHSEAFQTNLLWGYIAALTVFSLTRWTMPTSCSIRTLVRRLVRPLPNSFEASINKRVTAKFTATTIFSAMTVAILFSRTLDDRSYAYLAWGTPLLLWQAELHPLLMYPFCIAQERAWGISPGPAASPKTVLATLIVQILLVWWGTRDEADESPGASEPRSENSGG